MSGCWANSSTLLFLTVNKSYPVASQAFSLGKLLIGCCRERIVCTLWRHVILVIRGISYGMLEKAAVLSNFFVFFV